MSALRLIIIFSLLSLPCTTAWAERLTLRFAVGPDKYHHVNRWIHELGGADSETDTEPYSRITADLFIQLRALRTAGFDFDFELLQLPNLGRARLYAAEDKVDLFVESYWSDDPELGENDFLLSQPVIRNGETQVGLFTHESNKHALAAKNLEDVRNLRHVVVKDWHVDIRTIEAYKPQKVFYANDFEAMVRILKSGRADVGLIEFFGEPDFRHDHFGTIIEAIKGMKVGLSAERVYLVSTTHPYSNRLRDSLDKGIEIMRENGELRAILEKVGYYPKNVDGWKIINE